MGFSGVLIGYQMKTLDTIFFELARLHSSDTTETETMLKEYQRTFVEFATLYIIVTLSGLLVGAGSLMIMLNVNFVYSFILLNIAWIWFQIIAVGFMLLAYTVLSR